MSHLIIASVFLYNFNTSSCLALIVLCKLITLKVITFAFLSVTGLVGLVMRTAKVIGTFLLMFSCLNQSPENHVQPSSAVTWLCSSLFPVFTYITPLDEQIK
jgi:hypothetical protein